MILIRYNNQSCKMIPDNILCLLLTHLPLNLVWRFPGWNKRLNKLLMYEAIWREKCKREFILFPDDLAQLLPEEDRREFSYRIYYLVRSRNCCGRFYNDGEQSIKALTKIYDISEYRYGFSIVMNRDRLYSVSNGLVSEVISDVRITNSWWLLNDSRVIHIDEPNIANLYSTSRKVTYHESVDLSNNCFWFPDGRLVLSNKTTIPNVIEVVWHYNQLYFIQNDATLWRYSYRENNLSKLDGRYIKLLPIDDTISAVGTDGRCYEILHDTVIRVVVVIPCLPLRELYSDQRGRVFD